MFSANNMWIKIDGPNLFKGKVAIQISDPNTAFSKNRITKVKINDVNVSINEFVNDYISLDSAQTTVRNKLSIRNMSYLYTYLGVYIPTIIIWFLVPLSIIQSFLIFVFILNRLPESLSKLIPIVHQEDTKIFDYLTENFSIPLGLFGTIASVWTSFQLVSINLGDITAVIELISIGMFTTFLGMYCYSLLLVRHAWGNAIEK